MPGRFAEDADLRTCVHCGLCQSACPTYLELGTEADSPRGRIQLVRGLEEGRLEPTSEVVRHLDLCLGCRACETACPSGVPYGRIVEQARAAIEPRRGGATRLARRTLGRILTTRSLRRAVFAPARLVAGRAWVERAGRVFGGRAVVAAAYAAALPAPAREALPEVLEPEGPPKLTAVLMTGCVAETLFGATNVATARLLQRAGARVLVPRGQGCCGALPLHMGDTARAKALATSLAATLDASGPDVVISNAAGCGALLREWAHLLPGDPHAARVAARARDATEVLAELGLPPPPGRLDAAVAVHDPCHLAHAMGVREPVRALLGAVPGVRLVPLAESDTCCGSAGTYNLTEPAMAARLLARKLRNVDASGADVVVAANPGCLLQMRAGALARGLATRVEHPIDLLARAHGVA